jgi:DNA polymerase (family 10)
MTNTDVAALFKLMARIMQVHGEDPFKIRAYFGGAAEIEILPQELSAMDRKQVLEVPGIGKAISEKIFELLDTGRMAKLTEYLDITPDGIAELSYVRGLGGKKVAQLWHELHIASIEQLQEMCRSGKLLEVKGFGQKTVDSLLEEIEYYKEARRERVKALLDMARQQQTAA